MQSKEAMAERTMARLVREEVQRYDLPDDVEIGVQLVSHLYGATWRIYLSASNTLPRFFVTFLGGDSPESQMRKALAKLIEKWEEDNK